MGDEEKCFVPMKGDDRKEWEAGVGNFSLVSHIGREKEESGREVMSQRVLKRGGLV